MLLVKKTRHRVSDGKGKREERAIEATETMKKMGEGLRRGRETGPMKAWDGRRRERGATKDKEGDGKEGREGKKRLQKGRERGQMTGGEDRKGKKGRYGQRTGSEKEREG